MIEETKTYDAFLGYNSQEMYAVRALDSKLQACGVHCFLDSRELNLEQDSPVTPSLIHAINRSAVFVAIIGPASTGRWQAREIAKALKIRATEVNPDHHIILVCLPALAKETRESLRAAMGLNSAIVFESHLDEEGPFAELLHEIKGEIHRTQPDRTFPDEKRWIKENPYKGLKFFQEEDHDKFFGRGALTRALIKRIRGALKEPEATRLFVLLGASGCGKSSLARAGVVAELKQHGAIEGSKAWAYATLIPNDNPLASLAHAVADGLEQSVAKAVELAEKLKTDLRDKGEETLNGYLQHVGEGNKFVVLVDQFEETFTLCHDEKIRRTFIDNLRFAASQHNNGPGIVILTLRSDFQPFLAQYGISGPAYLDCLQNISPVEENELRDAIERPARNQGVIFESTLMGQLLKDARIEDRQLPKDAEAGTLPLLQDVLFKLWPYRQTQEGSVGETIPLDAYDAIGGVHGALAKRADEIYQSFSPDKQAIVRDIFLGLLHISPEGGPVTRKRVDSEVFNEEILNRLVKERLLVTDKGKVEIIHETLVRHWPTLHDWLKEDRENLYRRQQIEEDAQRWEQAARDDADVYSGNRFASTLDWQKQNAEVANPLGLSVLAEEFLRAGEKKAQAAEGQRKLFEVRRIMSEVQAMLDVQFDLSLLLSAMLGQDYPDMVESLATLLSTTQSHPKLVAFLQGHTSGVNHLAFSHNGHTLASASDDETVILWDVRDSQAPRKIQALQSHTRAITHLAFSHDDHTLASANYDETVILWDVRDPQAPREIQALQGHTGWVWHLAFSPDDRTLASASHDKTVILWEVRNPQAPREIRALQGHTDSVMYLAFSPDGRILASASYDKTVILWDVHDPQEPRKIKSLQGHSGKVTHLAFSPDGYTLASASHDNTVILWDVRAPQRSRKIQALQDHTDSVMHLVFSHDGHALASASYDNTVILWDVRARRRSRKIRALQGYTNEVRLLAFSPDDRVLALASGDKTVILWDVHDPQTWKIQTLQGHMNGVSHLAFSLDDHTLASASWDQTVILWDVRDPQTLRKIPALQGHTDWVKHLVFSHDDYTLASASDDNSVILWDVRNPRSPRKIQVLQGHAGEVRHLAFSHDDHTLASASDDKTVILWDVRDPQAPRKIQALQGHMSWVLHLAFSHDDHTLASASWDKTVILWDVHDPQTPRKIQALQGHTGEVRHLVFSHDDHILASASDDSNVILWNVRDPQAPREIQALQGHMGGVRHLAFSHDDHILASASDDNTVILWDVRDPQMPQKIHLFQDNTYSVYHLAFSHDDHTLASASDDNTVILWDVRTLQTLRKIQALQSHTDRVNHFAFSHDGHILASASQDKTIILWDMCDPRIPRKIQALQGHTSSVYRLAFSHGGHTLASASSDGTILLWDLDPASLARKACRIAGRNMTREEWRQYMGDKPYRKICEEFPVPGEG